MMTDVDNFQYVREHVRTVPDFPKKGIMFLDITTATKDAKSMQYMIDFLYETFENEKIDYVAGIESRGFIFGAPLAYKLNAGFIPIRKPNKLPADTVKETYSLEYGSDTLEMHKDAITKGQKVVIVDDVLATGGTIEAVANMVKQAGGIVVGVCVLGEIEALKPRERLKDYKVFSLMKY